MPPHPLPIVISAQPCDGGAVVTLTLQMKKLRQDELSQPLRVIASQQVVRGRTFIVLFIDLDNAGGDTYRHVPTGLDSSPRVGFGTGESDSGRVWLPRLHRVPQSPQQFLQGQHSRQ